ncbi:MAG: hypothetical protein ACFFBD_02230 [Candidatus Hodarchaeota archaeon]
MSLDQTTNTKRRYRINQIKEARIQDESVNGERKTVLVANKQNITGLRLFGTVIRKLNGKKNYIGLEIDDGSSTIFLKTWNGKLNDIERGDLIEVIGQIHIAPPREGQKEYDIYVNPDLVIPQLTREWELVHRLELLRGMMPALTLEDLPPSPIVDKSVRNKKTSRSSPKKIDTSTDQTKRKEKTVSQAAITPKGKKDTISSSKENLYNDLEQLILEGTEGKITYEEILEKISIPDFGIEEKEQLIDDALFQLLMDARVFEPSPGNYRHIDAI